MDRPCNNSSETRADSSSTSASSSNNGGKDAFLKHLSKLSHKISKPIRRLPENQGIFNSRLLNQIQGQTPPPPEIFAPPPAAAQPPVYNINKSDFREVVQKLTGAPPKPASSRLQRIRPPPLTVAVERAPVQSTQLFSPLPPLPAVHAAAESPISAYMRFLRGSISAVPPPPPSFPANISQFPVLPSSPLPFGCLPSPRSSYALLSPSGQMPLSPTHGRVFE